MPEIAQYGIVGLFFLATIEAIFFPIPPDTVLIPLVYSNPNQALILALTTTVGSLFGASIGYLLGLKGGRFLAEKLFSQENIKKAEDILGKYDVWAVTIAAVTPIPYKVFTILCGTLKTSFARFMIASVFGRGLRFFILAILVATFGEAIIDLIQNYFEILTIALVVFAAAVYWLYITVKKRIDKRMS